MKRLLRAAAAAAVGTSAFFAAGEARQARGQLVYDAFAYPAASPLDAKVNPIDGQPWAVMSNNAADDDILIGSGSLAHADLSAPMGNSASFSGTGKSERLGFDRVVRTGELYYSLVLRVSDLGAMTTGTPVVVAGFSDRSGTSAVPPQAVGTRLYLRQSANSVAGAERFNIGVSKNSGFDDIVFDPSDYSLSTPIFVVGSYQIVGDASGTDDVSKMWIDPQAASFGGASAPAATISAPVAGTDLTVSGVPSLAGFVLRQGVGVPSVQVDELRVDTAWARVTPPPGTTWSAGGGTGAWSSGANWSTLAAPNSPEAFVNFNDVGGGGGGGGAVTVNVDLPVTLRTININASAPHMLAAAGGSIQLSGSGGVNVRSGTHTIATPLTLAGESLFSVATGSTLNLTGNLAGNAGSIIKAGDGTLAMKHLRADVADVIAGSVVIAANGGPAATSRVSVLGINAGAAIDLSDNDLVVDYSGVTSPLGTSSGTSYDGLTGMIAAGRNGGAWNGSGIRTGRAEALSGLTSLGIGEASKLLGLAAGQTTMWGGQVVDDTSVLVRYTYRGDANVDGFISADDYTAIDFAIATPGAGGWTNGDFNYDGFISADDYTAIDFNLVAQGGPLGDAAVAQALPPAPASVAAVPEPAAFALAITTIAGGLLRRRRPRSRLLDW